MLRVGIASLVEQHQEQLTIGMHCLAQATNRLLHGSPATTLAELLEGGGGPLRGGQPMPAKAGSTPVPVHRHPACMATFFDGKE